MTPALDFAAAPDRHWGEPPHDHRIFVGRNVFDEVAHFRWRVASDLSEWEDDPHWARLDDDDLFHPVEWAPSTIPYRDLKRLYPLLSWSP